MERALTDKERLVLESFGCLDADEKARITPEDAILQKVANFDSMDYAWKRKKEYPTIEECIHAILDDDLDALQVIRSSVKDKYPKV